MNSPRVDEAEYVLRPRLWFPGIAFVGPGGAIELGASVGYSSREPAFRGLPCGQRSPLAHWTHAAWLVTRRALNEDVVADHAIVLPETLLDREALPHAHRWLREQPLVCVSGAKWSRLAKNGVRVFRVAFDVAGDGMLHIDVKGGRTDTSALAVSLEALDQAVDSTHLDPTQTAVATGDPSPTDRALRLLSGGQLDEAAVANAFNARSVIEDGYGYRGAPEGHFVDVAVVARQLRPLDSLFHQIYARASPMRAVARRLQFGILHAAPEAREIPAPIYGTAQRRTASALHVPRVDRLIVDGKSRQTLELPPERCWAVSSVDRWTPTLTERLELITTT